MKELNLEELSKGMYSSHEDNKNYVITNEGTLEMVWSATFFGQENKPELPKVDFDNEIVIGVYMGRKNNGGYNTSITGIFEVNNHVLVSVKESSPQPGKFYTQAITAPYHLVKVEKVDKEFVFDISELD